MMKLSVLSISLMLLVSCNNKSSQRKEAGKEKAQLKIAAYNVEYSKNATGKEIGEALKPFDFDVVCFCEAPGGDWTKNVGEVMGLNYAVVGKYSTAGHKDKYKTIVSKTPLYDNEEVLMADTLHTATRAKTKIGDTEFVIYAVHFPFGWRNQAHSDETTGKIKAFINYLKEKQNEEISVIAGDFNFRPSLAEKKNMYYEMFRDVGMDFTWNKLGIDWTKRNTYNAMVPADSGNGEVIDHIMFNTSKIDVVEGEIIEMEKPLSDHKPVWAELVVK
jgi:maltose 6'-phosphate phosphatase